MRLRYLIIPLALAAALGLSSRPVAAASESVANIAVTAQIGKSGAMDIVETIEYDFADVQPHAIGHGLPLTYHDDQGREFRIQFKLLGATLNGANISPLDSLTPESAKFKLPAGAPGPHRYQLHYTLSPTILRGETADIFRHNVTGLAWDVPIAQASFKFSGPGAVADNLTCFTGVQSTTTSNCEITQQGSESTVSTTAPLPPGGIMSAYASFPSGSFDTYLSQAKKPFWWLALVAPLAALMTLVVVIAVVLARRNPRRPPPAPPEA